MQVQARHAREADVQNDATFCAEPVGEEELLGGLEGHHLVTIGTEQPLQGLSDRVIIIHNEYENRFLGQHTVSLPGEGSYERPQSVFA